MVIFKIGSTDFSDKIQEIKIDYETLLSEDSGRNASGNNVVDVVNRKWKINLVFCPMTEDEVQNLFTAIQNYVVNVSFISPKTKALTTISAYHSTPSPEYMVIQSGKTIFRALSLNFIQM